MGCTSNVLLHFWHFCSIIVNLFLCLGEGSTLGVEISLCSSPLSTKRFSLLLVEIGELLAILFPDDCESFFLEGAIKSSEVDDKMGLDGGVSTSASLALVL